MKIKIVMQSGQSIPSNLRDMFYILTPDDSQVTSTEFSVYKGFTDQTAVTGNSPYSRGRWRQVLEKAKVPEQEKANHQVLTIGHTVAN